MKHISSEKLAGILITVSIHLAVIIVLLLTVVTPRLKSERVSMEFDFSEREKAEQLADELAKAKALNEKLDRMLEEAGVPVDRSSEVKNVRVDASLKDDRGTDAEELYKEAERIQREYEQNMSRKDEDVAELAPLKKEERKSTSSQDSYTGPSVLSYSLDGRKGSYLPIPAYKCMGAGEVTVIVSVDPNGNVVAAKIHEEISSEDKCLREYALRAARQSRFSKKADAPARQPGNIVYAFIAQ